MSVSYLFSANGLISAAELNTNFQDVLDELTNLDTSNLSATAGIVSTQLADRFAYSKDTVHLAPYYIQNVTPADTELTYLPSGSGSGTGVEVWRSYIQARSGKSLWLCGVSIYAQTVSINGGTPTAYPAVWVMRNGAILGGSNAEVRASDTVYYLKNTNPFDDPITSLSDGDYLTIGLGTAAAAADTGWAGVTVDFWYKMELGA